MAEEERIKSFSLQLNVYSYRVFPTHHYPLRELCCCISVLQGVGASIVIV